MEVSIERVLEFLQLSPVALKERIDAGMDAEEMLEIAKTLEQASAMAAFQAQYLNERGGYYCGDQGHERALAQANTRHRRVRKALGFNVTPDLSF